MLIRWTIFSIDYSHRLSNFIPHRLSDDRYSSDDKEIKKLIHEKKNIFKCFRRSNNNKQFDRLKDLQSQLIRHFSDIIAKTSRIKVE